MHYFSFFRTFAPMKRRLLYLFVLFLEVLPLTVWGQVNENTNLDSQYTTTLGKHNSLLEDSIRVNSEDINPMPVQWSVDGSFGNINAIKIDTLVENFSMRNLNEGATGHYNHLGNLGSPRISHVWSDRTDELGNQMVFLSPYAFYKNPDSQCFTNARLPITKVSYFKAGSSTNKEENFGLYFTRNAGKRFSVGFDINYLYARGFYQYQSNAHFNASFFASYIGTHYEAHGMYRYYYMKVQENGGITDDRYITDPEAMAEGTRQFDAKEMPVLFDNSGAAAFNRNRLHEVFFTHNYKVGFTRHHEEYVVRDSTRTDTIHKEEFIPVSKFIHTLSVQSNKHSFYSSLDSSKNVSNWRYANTYLTNDFTSADSTTYTSIRNLFGVSLLEGFNKYAKAGLTVFLEHEFREVSLMPYDSLVAGAGMETFRENEIYAGGILAKKEGNLLHYSALGKVGILGEALGQFDLHGSLDLNFSLGGDTVQFVARGKIQNKLPAFYYRHYRSNHFRWDNDLDKEFRSRVEGELSWARTHTRLRAGIENIKNYTYLNSEALPTQEAKNFQVFDFQINQDFRMGILHWDNEAIYQHSTNKALPLPDLSLYSNLYLDTYLAKRVMHVQMGVDVRYFSEYDAPTYTAALGQYNLQSAEDKVSIGGYPLVSAYVNVRVKKTRFFVQMYHLNQGNGNYFTVAHYPLNPSLLKMGLSIYFYD